MFTAFVAALVLAPAADVPVITPEYAYSHAGRDVVVQGQVTQVGASEDGKTLFLNFGGRYPDHVFNALIRSKNLQSFPDARSWEGRLLKVRGKIQLYKGTGKPEIILKDREQVTIDSSATSPQGPRPPRLEAQGETGAAQEVGGLAEQTSTARAMDYDSPPRPIKIARPQYPQEAFVKKIEGTVVVEILIDAQGRVVRAKVIQSVPLLDAAALECVYQWTFQPAIKHGQPVPTIAHAPVAFRCCGGSGGLLGVPGSMFEQRKQQPVKGSE